MTAQSRYAREHCEVLTSTHSRLRSHLRFVHRSEHLRLTITDRQQLIAVEAQISAATTELKRGCGCCPMALCRAGLTRAADWGPVVADLNKLVQKALDQIKRLALEIRNLYDLNVRPRQA